MNLISISFRIVYSHNQTESVFSMSISPIFSFHFLTLSGWQKGITWKGRVSSCYPCRRSTIFTFHSELQLLPGFCGGGEVEIKRNGIKKGALREGEREPSSKVLFFSIQSVYIYFSVHLNLTTLPCSSDILRNFTATQQQLL